ncbi:MAG: hypothetical protein LBU22_01580 [Dysgonamonadaceae bacterium]|jgi:hypothetical protein|nr:hypothetical protein [Dysgonamonadaceae bacterium]
MKISFPLVVRIFLIILLIHCFRASYPVNETFEAGVNALSLGQVKALGNLSNPALIAFETQKQAGVSVFSRFGMKELSTKSLYGIFPNRIIDAGFRLSTYGFEDYQLLSGQVSLAKKLSSGLSLGVNLGYSNEYSILETHVNNNYSAGMGIYWQPDGAFEWAFTAENLLHTTKAVPALFFGGFRYRLTSTFCVLMEANSDFRNNFHLSAGAEYEIAEQFTVRCGFQNKPQTPSFGLSYNGIHWGIETAFLLHPILGLSSAIGVNYYF